jgi:hypothetical protein
MWQTPGSARLGKAIGPECGGPKCIERYTFGLYPGIGTWLSGCAILEIVYRIVAGSVILLRTGAVIEAVPDRGRDRELCGAVLYRDYKIWSVAETMVLRPR